MSDRETPRETNAAAENIKLGKRVRKEVHNVVDTCLSRQYNCGSIESTRYARSKGFAPTYNGYKNHLVDVVTGLVLDLIEENKSE